MTFEESSKASSYSDDTAVTEHIWRKQLTLRKPHTSSPATTQCSKILLEWPCRTRLGWIVERPGHLKDDVTWTLATEHWTLTLLLTFEYLLLTTWGYCYWPIRLLKTSEIFRVMHANTCVPALDLCIRVFDIELMLLGMIKLIAIFLFLWFNSGLVLNSFSFVLVLVIFFFFILGRMWHVAWLFIMPVIPPM